MPVTLTRSIMTIVLPGGVALSPIFLWLTTFPYIASLFSSHLSLILFAMFGLIIIVGSIFEIIASHLEKYFDSKCEAELNVRENWYKYLSCQFESEPIGFRYLSRRFTTMYFELGMSMAAPIFVIGVMFVHLGDVENHILWKLIYIIVAGVLCKLFYWSGKNTHRLLCETRYHLNKRLAKSRIHTFSHNYQRGSQ